jgi:hypothetical protein
VAVQIELGSFPVPDDERKYQGRPHDLLVFDEASNMRESSVRFLLGWLRTTDPRQRCRALMTFNPPSDAEGRWVVRYFAPWLDKKHPRPAAPGELRWFATIDGRDEERENGQEFEYRGEKIRPISRTFIPSKISDNPYLLGTGYMATLQALPEPLRSQMLHGDFEAGLQDSAFQVIPTAWVEAAQERWRRPQRLGEMMSIGVDVAMGGKDLTVIARRHASPEGPWFDEPIVYSGQQSVDGPTVAGFCMAAKRDDAPIHLDLFGVGAQPYGHLMAMHQHVIGVNVGEPARGLTSDGRVGFRNLRSELWWRMREALEPAKNTGLALPPSRELLADLCAPWWSMKGNVLQVASRDEIREKTGRSPDYGTAYVLALMDTPKQTGLPIGRSNREYDPYAGM